MWETTSADRARWAVCDQVREVARLLDQGEGVQLLGPDHPPDVEPLTGLRAALFVSRAATDRMREYAEQARSKGASWRALGDALGLAKDAERHNTPLGQAAWWFVVEGVRPGHAAPDRRDHSSRWTCGTCEQRVTDWGPFDADPTECEQGHASGCARHHAALTAYEDELRTGEAE